MRTLVLAICAVAAFAAPAMAITVETKSAGAIIPLRAQPSDNARQIGGFESGTVIEVDYCTATRPSRFTISRELDDYLDDIDYESYCRVPGYGWVPRDGLVGAGLGGITQPRFNGPRF
jgi:hypothetical protein